MKVYWRVSDNIKISHIDYPPFLTLIMCPVKTVSKIKGIYFICIVRVVDETLDNTVPNVTLKVC